MRATATLLVAAVVAVGCAGDDETADRAATDVTTTTAAPVRVCENGPTACPLGAVADRVDVLVGTATSSDRLGDPAYERVLATEFNSITAENEMKWAALQPQLGVYDFTGADELVEFAEANAMAVKGHTLIWEQETLDATPDWVQAITDPVELRGVVRDHFEQVLGHFGDRVDRWDVVNEPLETLGVEVYENHFHQVLGPDYIDEMFVLAHEISPATRLFLNEAAAEIQPDKADALVDLVAGMVDRGVPIDGVGLQAHLLGAVPEPGVIADLIDRLSALGVEVAITELDIVAPDGADRLTEQAAGYARVVEECLTSGCREITVWGLDDGHTWLDDFFGRDDTDPLLFDAALEPKPAHGAVRATVAGLDPDG